MNATDSSTPLEKPLPVEEIMAVVRRDRNFFDASGGGVTLTGGEPFLQEVQNLVALLEALKAEGIHIVAETCLLAPWETIQRALPLIDLFYVDLKAVGDDSLHKAITGASSKRIQENLKKLMDAGAAVKVRMVMVPGLNDTEANLKATAALLTELGIPKIELLRYHNLYEQKIKELGLNRPLMGITPAQSRKSLEYGLTLLGGLGIEATNPDVEFERKHKPKPAEFTPRVKQIWHDVRGSKRYLCIEAAKLKTLYYRKYKGFKKPVAIHRAERLAYVLRNKMIKVYPGELLVGNYTSKRLAGQLWVEYYGSLLITIMYKLYRTYPVPFHISAADQLYFTTRIFPYWVNRDMMAHVVPRVDEFIKKLSRITDLGAGFTNNLAAIAHFIVNFDVILEKGTSGLIAELRAIQEAHPENDPNFYEGAIIGLRGLEDWAQRHADHLTALSQKEKDPQRRAELAKMAQVCSRVPKLPAETFHEALQSMLFLHIALSIEAYENAVSFGRLDQVLYPYYKRDVEAGRITYDEAKELLALFVLKVEELILVNDGESFLNMNSLFETISTDQAVTFGGVDARGRDATNDVTYMLVDTCELQPISIDMGARIHKESPQKYVDRLAEVYLNGCPVPQIFADDVYIDAIMKHYPTTLEDARNYCIVGCVEPTASDDHFGNTDCANVNLTYPLLQALKGTDVETWNKPLGDLIAILNLNWAKFLQKSKTVNKIADYFYELIKRRRGHYRYQPIASMDELLVQFQKKLNRVTRSILTEHQYIELNLQRNFITPVSSALFRRCRETGRDLYYGGAKFNSSGIQAVGVTDVADSLHAIEEVVFRQKRFSVNTLINAIDNNFEGKYQRVREALLAVPKFGDDGSPRATEWMNRVLAMYNTALQSVPHLVRGGRYSAGYYALNVCNRYGKATPALPSGRLAGEPLANSITPHYGMEESNLFSTLNAMAKIDFRQHAENGTTATLTIDASHFRSEDGVRNLGAIFKTYLTSGGMQLQPNVISKEILLEAYHHPEKHKYLLVRIAGYCAYFNDLSDEMKRIVINRAMHS
jgi:formate C-acetyltransferase